MSEAPVLALVANPVLDGVYTCLPAPTGLTMPRMVQRIIELFDGSRSVAEICAHAQIPEVKGLAIVKKLSSLGLVRREKETTSQAVQAAQDQTVLSAFEREETLRDLPSNRADRAGFSAAEEAFFASDVASVEEEPGRSLGEKVSLFVSDWVLRIRGTAL